MSEQNQNQEGQKTIVSFIVGLLIGGLIVWMFSGDPAETPVDVDNGDVDVEETATTTDENGGTDAPAEEENNGDTTEETTEDVTEEAPSMETGDAEVSVSNQPASSRVALDAVTFPMSDGWIGVREYTNDRLGSLLGVARFGESEGLIPEEIVLQRATESGREYAIVFYTAGPTNDFNLADNEQLDGIFATFTAQ